MDPRIIEYYKFCSVRSKNEEIVPIQSLVKEQAITAILTEEQKTLYLKPYGNAYTVRETVIGAGRKAGTEKIIII